MHSWDGYVIVIDGCIFSGSRPQLYAPYLEEEGVPQYLPGQGLVYPIYDKKNAIERMDVLKRNAPEGVKIRLAKVTIIDETED